MARRGWPSARSAGRLNTPAAQALDQSPATAAWQSIGPTAVSTPAYGLVTGRISALAFDPADSTGNRLFVGATGGGVWLSQNAGTSNLSYLAFTPLTDTLSALSGVENPSIGIGALTVQPGSTGVILAGTGDPNDALDSYYGAGILRSTDNGNSWSLIQMTVDQYWGFLGEGFAGFAWSTVSPQTVVAAVSQAYEGELVSAPVNDFSYTGLYYSTDSGATWNLATVADAGGAHIQGPNDAYAFPDGNPATAVVWNPVRQLFIAAVRYHGYYQSSDGIDWTRIGAQPGANLTAKLCPTRTGLVGSATCPIFRGALAVNPQTGDTFAWTVDSNNQDQGLWQDLCAVSGGSCSNPVLAFTKQLPTSALETNTSLGAATIANGDYNLVLAALPSGQDTLLLAGDNDLWKCSLAMNCAWRNTTNATTCMSAGVGAYQHALAWNPSNPAEIFLGNDSGLWRSTDAIAETGSACAATDASHFQNLNGSLGSLAEVESLAQSQSNPYELMAGLGANGTAGVKDATAPTGDWPQILGGEGGPVAIDPTNDQHWYVNNAVGVSIQECSQAAPCTASTFGLAASITNADVGGDALAMTAPAPFLVDPLDPSQLLVATCRVWRGPASGGWTAANAVSPILDGGAAATYCSGDALIRSLAALSLGNGKEVVYVGIYGSLNGGGNLAGHVLKAVIDSTGAAMPVWTDLTPNPVSNDASSLNFYEMDVSSIYIDPHDASGNTVYVTIAGWVQPGEVVRTIYRSTDGGATWANAVSNLPQAPANSVVIDPQDQSTAYIATDRGVYSTRQVATCTNTVSNCWSAYGTGLPEAPVVALSASPATATAQLLTAATYGRGLWQIPLWTASTQPALASATATPASLTFSSQAEGSTSPSQTVTLTNTGTAVLTVAGITVSGDFAETDDCTTAAVSAAGNCAIEVAFTPTATGARSGQLYIAANISSGGLTVPLTGTASSPPAVNLSPATIDFGKVEVGTTSSPLQVAATNSGGSPVDLTSLTVSGPFVISSNTCGTTSLAANTACQILLEFLPVTPGSATGTLTMVDAAGTQAVGLTGTGAAPPTDNLSPASLTFPGTIIGQLSQPQTVSIANTGDLPLTSIATTVSGAFQVAGNCGTQLAAQSSCSIAVTFAPVAAGSQNGTLTVSDLLRTQTVPLAGVGLLPPVFSVNPASLTFAAQAVGTTSAAQTVTIGNTGGAPMANVGFQITGPSASSFATGATTCGAALSNVSGSNTCTVQVAFTPAASGGNTATLVVSSSTIGVTAAQVALNGNGTSSMALSVNPTQLSFSTVAVGQASAAQTVTVSNSGASAAASLSLAVVAPFSLAQNTCSGALAAGASCTTGVVFTPSTAGAATGALSITSSTVATPSSVSLGGVGGLPASIQATPGSVSFGAVGVGVTSAPSNLTIANSGTMGSLTNLVLSASSGFQLIGNTCTATLAPQANCTVGVEFAPSAAGAQTGSVQVVSDAVKSPVQVAVSGTGVDFTVKASGSATQTVSSGQTANFNLSIAPLGGMQAAYTYQCGTLPAFTLCTFDPASETISGSATGTVTVELATGESTAAALPGVRSLPPSRAWPALPLLCGLVLLFRTAGQRARRLGPLLLLLAAITWGAGSCASSSGGSGGSGPGGGSGGSGSNTTPAGAYSVVVTVSSSGVSHSIPLTLIVD